MPPDTPAIEIRDLVHRYPDGTQALKGISLRVAPGERVALLGPNGAGKSTLIGHLNGNTQAQAGEIVIAGTLISQATVARVRERVGVVFQDPDNMLFMTRLADDIAFGPRNMGLPEAEVGRRVTRALAEVGLTDLAAKPGLHLSVGQKKRAALAAVLAMAPAVLILDEPTANLDPRSRRAMIELLAGLAVTLLVATPDMDLAWTLCERAVVLDKGDLVADGPARTLMVDEVLMHRHGLEVPHLAPRPIAAPGLPPGPGLG